MLELFERYFDHLLVHGDPALVPFDRTFVHAPRIADEAVALLTAKQCPQDATTSVILSPNQPMPQTHESCGHPTEPDRPLGTEAALAAE